MFIIVLLIISSATLPAVDIEHNIIIVSVID